MSGKTPRSIKEGERIPVVILNILQAYCRSEERADLPDGHCYGLVIEETPGVPLTLERDNYEYLNEVLERLGGQYLTGKRLHGFPYDPAPLIASVLTNKVMPPRNPFDFFESTPIVLRRFREQIAPELREHMPWDFLLTKQRDGEYCFRILEPSAGEGALADLMRELFPDAEIVCCEIDPYRRSVLEKKGYTVVATDFQRFWDPIGFDLIVMNPPFRDIRYGHSAYIVHIQRALRLLRDHNSHLFTVAPAGFMFNGNQPYYDFYSQVMEHGWITPLPEDAFAESGTMSKAVFIEMLKTPCWPYNHGEKPVEGYPNGYLYTFFQRITWEENYARQIDTLFARMITGELPVYADGRPAPETREAILHCGHQIADDARRHEVHMPLRKRDEDAFVLTMLEKFENEYDNRWPIVRENILERRFKKVEEAERALATRQKIAATLEKEIKKLKERLKEAKVSLPGLEDMAKRAREQAEAEGDWMPPARPDASPPASLLDLFDLAAR